MPARRARKTSKRTIIEPQGDRRCVRRSKTGQFKKEVASEGHLLPSVGEKQYTAAKGQGDPGDTK
jgi:hypothetical protein